MTYKERRANELNELLNAKPRIQDDDTPDPDDIMAKVVAWDFERLLKSFVQNREDMAKALEVRDIWFDHDDVVVQESPTYGTIRRSA